MKFKDYFSKQAELYAKYRPKYPQKLFEYLSSITEHHQRAWDTATGNGQAAIGLAPYFDKIIATDASRSQIEHAEKHPKVTYSVAKAEQSNLPSCSVDLIVAATAIHWFDLPAFYDEVRRILKPGGVFAAWQYSTPLFTEQVDEVVKYWYTQIIGKYVAPEISKAFDFENKIEFPFQRIQTPNFDFELNWNLDDLVNFLLTWSCTQSYINENNSNPIDIVIDDLRKAWGNENHRKMSRWKLYLKAGKVG
jgi:ubiquinone/menaquinone biosynthesis C-methylase UbiE